MSIFSRALNVHANALNRAAGEWITYKRGSLTFRVKAVPGESRFENISSDGEIRAETKTVDFLISPSGLCNLLDEQPNRWADLVPSRGDQVIRENGDTMDLIPGADDSVWEWSDSRQSFYRIHTAKRSTGNVEG